MKLSEIDKSTFHRKLADPAAQELIEIIDDLNHALYPQKFEVDGENKDAAMITGIPPRFGEEYGGHLDGVNLITSIKRRIVASEHWVWDTWEGDVEEYFNAYVIKKT
jgi:hypothetical protein